MVQALFHTLLLVWTHSKHYNTSARLVPLLRLIVEDVIAQCRKFLPGAPLPADPSASERGTTHAVRGA